ncbi:MAG: hypothetical protein KJO76_00115 [Gammaproteobacteria bacterium]|nr:hypothetical protein [Gammaproteobacteria bacterium]NND36915.1 hypothetical protein [Gammaproteobacteria bacterium]
MRCIKKALLRGLVYAWLMAASFPVLAESSVPMEPIDDPVDYRVEAQKDDMPWAFTLYTVWLSK